MAGSTSYRAPRPLHCKVPPTGRPLRIWIAGRRHRDNSPSRLQSTVGDGEVGSTQLRLKAAALEAMFKLCPSRDFFGQALQQTSLNGCHFIS